MTYLRRHLGDGEVDKCAEDPDDPICKEFYSPPAPSSGTSFFNDVIDKGKELLASTPASPTAPAAKPGSKSALIPVVLVGGGAAALWLLLRKKKRS